MWWVIKDGFNRWKVVPSDNKPIHFVKVLGGFTTEREAQVTKSNMILEESK